MINIMSLPPLSLLETHILQILKDGPLGTIALIQCIQKLRPKATKQGIYLALRKMRKEEIVLVHNKIVSFNILWLKRMNEFIGIAEQHHGNGEISRESFVNLKEGEKITYHFADANQTDTFWWQALYLLSETDRYPNEPVYLYNPHEWFLLGRRESELESMKLITRKRQWLLLSGSKTPLDRAVAKDFDGERSQYHMLQERPFSKINYYFNIVGDFLIEVWIDPSIAGSIEDLYEETKTFDEKARVKLKNILQMKGRSKLAISRNSRKAEKYKKLLRGYFYIQQKTRQ